VGHRRPDSPRAVVPERGRGHAPGAVPGEEAREGTRGLLSGEGWQSLVSKRRGQSAGAKRRVQGYNLLGLIAARPPESTYIRSGWFGVYGI
jgi:hypothetical protein